MNDEQSPQSETLFASLAWLDNLADMYSNMFLSSDYHRKQQQVYADLSAALMGVANVQDQREFLNLLTKLGVIKVQLAFYASPEVLDLIAQWIDVSQGGDAALSLYKAEEIVLQMRREVVGAEGLGMGDILKILTSDVRPVFPSSLKNANAKK